MNKNISKIYLMIKDNKAILGSSNLEDFYRQLPESLKEATSQTFRRRFDKNGYFVSGKDTECTFQMLSYEKANRKVEPKIDNE